MLLLVPLLLVAAAAGGGAALFTAEPRLVVLLLHTLSILNYDSVWPCEVPEQVFRHNAVASHTAGATRMGATRMTCRAIFSDMLNGNLVQALRSRSRQVCFNYTGGKCFRADCRFLHIGPGPRLS